MTIARDIHTGAVVGQVLDPIRPSVPPPWTVVVLTKDGVKAVPLLIVKLEEA